MAYDPSTFKDSFSSPAEMVCFDGDLFFSDPFFPFHDPAIDFDLQELTIPQTNSSHGNLSVSPPSHQLGNLTLYQPPLNEANSVNNSIFNANGDFSGLDVKTEVGYDNSCMPHSYSSSEENNVTTLMMQRSYSSNCFDRNVNCGHQFRPCFGSLVESPNYLIYEQLHGQLRRVCSTGDLHDIRANHKAESLITSPLAANEKCFTEESNFKVTRYSAEERKERISKYRAKRRQRNFTKTIKYACRKTLADNRPRIRGRFARNDESVETPKATSSSREEDEDELWFDGFNEDEETTTLLRETSLDVGGSYVREARFGYINGF